MREPPRYDFRLENLRAWHLVEAACSRCGHKAAIAHQLLMRGRPSFTRLFDLERALRCRRCGARGQASLAVRPALPGLTRFWRLRTDAIGPMPACTPLFTASAASRDRDLRGTRVVAYG